MGLLNEEQMDQLRAAKSAPPEKHRHTAEVADDQVDRIKSQARKEFGGIELAIELAYSEGYADALATRHTAEVEALIKERDDAIIARNVALNNPRSVFVQMAQLANKHAAEWRERAERAEAALADADDTPAWEALKQCKEKLKQAKAALATQPTTEGSNDAS